MGKTACSFQDILADVRSLVSIFSIGEMTRFPCFQNPISTGLFNASYFE